MKKIVTIFAIASVLMTSVGTSFADDDYIPAPEGSVFYNNDQVIGGGDSVPISGNNDYGNTWYTDSTYVPPATGSTFSNYDTNCTWCNNNIVTSSGNDYGNTWYTDSTYVPPATGSTFYNYDTNCNWCNQSTAYTTTPTVYNSSYGYGTGYTSLSIGATNYGTTYGSYYQPPIIAQTGQMVVNNPVINNPAPVTNNRCSYTQDAYTSSYTNNYPTCTKVCINGATVAGTTSCPAPTPVNNTCSYTQDAYTSSYTNNYPTCSKVCTNGQTVSGNTTCTGPVVTPNPTYVCPNGQTVTYSYQCPSIVTPPYVPPYTPPYVPPVTQYTCPNGSIVTYSYQCPTYVPPYTPPYVAPYTPPYVAPQVIKFNNVVTSTPTQITQTSARCNGIGLIAQGAQSTGWFEYGQTANLGRVTATAAIGSAASAPFSNVLAGLQPSTTYYCRAVMQNQYGTVKGEVVKFTTKATAVHYVAPAVKKTVTKTVTKTVAKSNLVTCSDGSSFTVGSSAAAASINNGQKLATLSLEKVNGDLVSGGNVSYRLIYKNLSDIQLRDVTLKVTIPAEIAVQNVSGGSYDNDTHQLTLNLGTLNPYQEGVLSWSGKMVQNVREGQSIVSTGYLGYTVTNAQGQSVQDEVTAYVVGSISSVISTAAGAQHVIGADGSRSFLPESLVEWLALIAILFIIFVLGRSVASSYKNEKDAHH